MSNLTLSGGINNIQHPGNLPPNVQVSIKNISFDATGKLSIHKEWLPETEPSDTLSVAIFENYHTIKKIYQWIPAYLPLTAYTDDAYKDIFVVFYIDTNDGDKGKVKIVYRTAADVYTSTALTTDDIAVNEVMGDADSWQFIFVDGRSNHKARRIAIDQNGVVSVSYIGMSAIFLSALVKTVLYTSEDNLNTGIGQGNLFAYRYSFRNEYGEKSPVSPLTVFDLLDYKKRGTFVDSTYTYDETARGSLKEIQLEITIPADAVYLDLWRQDADGNENQIGFSQMRLVKSIYVKGSGTPLTVKDNYPYGLTGIDLLQDDSPKADVVAISNASIIFANATNALNFPYNIAVMWKLYITNNNPVSYLNKFIEFDLFDLDANNGVSGSYINASIADLLPANFRFMDTDMITSLESYWSSAFNLPSYKLTDNSEVLVHRLCRVRIPEILPYSTKIIYFVIAGDSNTTPLIEVTPNPLAFGSVYPAID